MKKEILKITLTLVLLLSFLLFRETKDMLGKVVPMFADAFSNAQQLDIHTLVVITYIALIAALVLWFRYGCKMLTPHVIRLWISK